MNYVEHMEFIYHTCKEREALDGWKSAMGCQLYYFDQVMETSSPKKLMGRDIHSAWLSMNNEAKMGGRA